jgi:hypothetical protein
MPKFKTGDIVQDKLGAIATIRGFYLDIFMTETYYIEFNGVTVDLPCADVDRDCTLTSGVPAPTVSYHLPPMPPPPPSTWAQVMNDSVKSPMHSTWCDKAQAS